MYILLQSDFLCWIDLRRAFQKVHSTDSLLLFWTFVIVKFAVQLKSQFSW